MSDLKCTIVTPEQTVRETSADFVALMLYDGEIGIAPSRAPLIGRLGYGEMRIRQGEQTDRYYIEGGFVEVIGDTVSVLTNRAVPALQLEEAVAREQLTAAQARPAHTPELRAIRDQSVAQARGQLTVVRRAR
jgi:F-type H+-transporting ATPase subunit epsilon